MKNISISLAVFALVSMGSQAQQILTVSKKNNNTTVDDELNKHEITLNTTDGVSINYNKNGENQLQFPLFGGDDQIDDDKNGWDHVFDKIDDIADDYNEAAEEQKQKEAEEEEEEVVDLLDEPLEFFNSDDFSGYDETSNNIYYENVEEITDAPVDETIDDASDTADSTDIQDSSSQFALNMQDMFADELEKYETDKAEDNLDDEMDTIMQWAMGDIDIQEEIYGQNITESDEAETTEEVVDTDAEDISSEATSETETSDDTVDETTNEAAEELETETESNVDESTYEAPQEVIPSYGEETEGSSLFTFPSDEVFEDVIIGYIYGFTLMQISHTHYNLCEVDSSNIRQHFEMFITDVVSHNMMENLTDDQKIELLRKGLDLIVSDTPSFFMELGNCEELGYHAQVFRRYGLSSANPFEVQDQLNRHIVDHEEEVIEDSEKAMEFEQKDQWSDFGSVMGEVVFEALH